MMDLKTILASLDGYVDALAPLAAAFGPQAALVGAMASAANDVVQDVARRVEEGQWAATSEDQVALKALADKLAAENDRLAAVIAAS
jgi:hypothetical protein